MCFGICHRRSHAGPSHAVTKSSSEMTSVDTSASPTESRITIHSTESSAPSLSSPEESEHDFQRVNISGEDKSGVRMFKHRSLSSQIVFLVSTRVIFTGRDGYRQLLLWTNRYDYSAVWLRECFVRNLCCRVQLFNLDRITVLYTCLLDRLMLSP